MSARYQEILDEHKEELSSELYLKLCNLNMEENKKEENKQLFCQVKYLIPEHYYDDDNDSCFRVEVKTIIARIPTKEYQQIKKDILKNDITYNREVLKIEKETTAQMLHFDEQCGRNIHTVVNTYPMILSIEDLESK